jgi:hypothetical protein
LPDWRSREGIHFNRPLAEPVYRHGIVATVVFIVIFAALAWVWEGGGSQRSVPVLVPFARLLLGR